MFISSFKSKSVLIILIINYVTFIWYDLNLSQFWICWRTGNYVHKVQTFREAHKNLFNLPHALDIYLVNVQSMRKIAQTFVCFSESPNFNDFLLQTNLGAGKILICIFTMLSPVFRFIEKNISFLNQVLSVCIHSCLHKNQ